MSAPDFDLASLSVDERLDLIDKIWLSIAADAKRGDENAAAVLDLDRPLPPDVLAELHRRADELERDPSKGIPWEDLLEELRRTYK
ncbi:MAG: addiction module protein [Alphaproteobacteria bacterium]|nr:addiction module protein [Alphaproteobacteria bacterium]